MRACSRALTLVEVLVVIAIIGVLIGLLLPVSRLIRERAHWLATANRVELVRRALGAVAVEDGSAALALQRAAGLPGVLRTSFHHHHADPAQRGLIAATEGSFLDYGPSWQLRFPLGQRAVGFTSQNPYAWSGGHTNWDFVLLSERDPIPFTLAEMTARFSAELLVAGGIAADVAAVRSDRNPDRGWNDAWGHPLIVALAMFQYGPTTAAAQARWPWTHAVGERGLGSKGFTQQWKDVREHYGTNRRLYLAVGAIGPEGPSAMTASLTDADLDACWQQIQTLCNTADDGSALWRIAPTATPPLDALANPPWQGLRQRKAASKQSLLALPLVIE